MSSASIPAPRAGAGSPSRHNYFLPILVYLAGAGLLAFYQLQTLEDQLSQITSAADKLDVRVRMSQYEQGKFYALARDLLRLAPTHPAAAKIVDETGIRKIAQAHPDLMSLTMPSGYTNTAPVEPPKPGQDVNTNAGPSASLIQQ